MLQIFQKHFHSKNISNINYSHIRIETFKWTHGKNVALLPVFNGKTITAIYLADLTAKEDLSSFSGKNRKAIAEADRVLVRQRTNGGWAKGTEGHNELKLRLERDEDDTTLDNGTTHREIRILAHACTSTKLARFREGCLAGLSTVEVRGFETRAALYYKQWGLQP